MWHGRPKQKSKQGNSRVLAGILAGLLLGALAIHFCNSALRPGMIAVATDQLSNQIEDEVCGVVEEYLSSGAMQYSDICTTLWDENGKMCGLQADMTQLNRLKSEISSRVAEEFDDSIVRHRLQVPIGSVLPVLTLHGQGPTVPVVVLSAGDVSAEFDSEFISTGINQTLHRVALLVETKLHLLLPGGVYEYTEQTRLVLAETVLLGDVPDSYSYFAQVEDLKEAYQKGRYRLDRKKN